MVVVLLAVLLAHAPSSGEPLLGRTLRPAVGLVPGLAMAYFKSIDSALRPFSHAVVTLDLLAALLSAVVLVLVGCSVSLASRPKLRRAPVARLLLFPTL